MIFGIDVLGARTVVHLQERQKAYLSVALLDMELVVLDQVGHFGQLATSSTGQHTADQKIDAQDVGQQTLHNRG